MAVWFALVNHVHHLIRAGDKALGASLRIARAGLTFHDCGMSRILYSIHVQGLVVSHLDIWHTVFILVDRQVGLCHYGKKIRFQMMKYYMNAAFYWIFVLGNHHPASHGFCPCRFQNMKPFRDKVREKRLCQMSRIDKHKTNPTDDNIKTLMWNSRFSSMAKMWLKMSSAMRGMMPIWWGSCSLPWNSKLHRKMGITVKTWTLKGHLDGLKNGTYIIGLEVIIMVALKFTPQKNLFFVMPKARDWHAPKGGVACFFFPSQPA